MSRVTPPQMIGVHDVADLFGITPEEVRRRVRSRHRPTLVGYFGKVGGRHIWNAHELFAQMFSTDARLDEAIKALTNPKAQPVATRVQCGAKDCGDPSLFAGLCRLHLRHFMRAWYRAGDSSLYLQQFVGMCRWIVERHAHLVLPADYDPFDTVCMKPGCTNQTNTNGRAGPLCTACSNEFWNHSPLRPRPEWWRRPRKAA